MSKHPTAPALGLLPRLVTQRLGVLTSVAAAAVAISAAPAAAHPNHPPHNPAWCGAENMRSAYTHMADAMMYHTNDNGDDGMRGAVANRPENCR